MSESIYWRVCHSASPFIQLENIPHKYFLLRKISSLLANPSLPHLLPQSELSDLQWDPWVKDLMANKALGDTAISIEGCMQ